MPRSVHLGFLILLMVLATSGCRAIASHWLRPDSSSRSQMAQAPTSSLQQGQITSQNRSRSFVVYLPSRYRQGDPLPLVLAFHGGRGSGEQLARNTNFNSIAEREGFIVVYPDGIRSGNAYSWNDARQTNDPNEAIDDLGFIQDLLDELMAIYSVDPARIYAVGTSNGGFLVQTLACQQPDRFAAFASVSATLPDPLQSTCQPSRSIPLVMIHGSADRIVPWAGGTVAGPAGGEILSVPATLAFWRDHNGCAGVAQLTELPDRDPTDGTRVVLHDATGCPTAGSVEVYEVVEGGHGWPGSSRGRVRENLVGKISQDINAAEVIWTFFNDQRLP